MFEDFEELFLSAMMAFIIFMLGGLLFFASYTIYTNYGLLYGILLPVSFFGLCLFIHKMKVR